VSSDAEIAAATAGSETAFAAVTERHRRELQLHCYRMTGSLHDSEDLVQETFLRAWRGRRGFTYRGPTSFRAWLYRVATNACFDLLARRPRTAFPGGGEPGRLLAPDPDLAWLQPYPDRLLAPAEEQPEAQAVARETVELAFIVAVQRLPPQQRAVLLLRDVLGWPAKDTAALLETTVAAANSALQRARETLRRHLPRQRLDWAAEPSAAERAVVQRYMDAHERRDFGAMAALLREDARLTMPPTPSWFAGREAIAGLFASWLDPASPAYAGEVRRLPARANGRPAAVGYLRGEAGWRALGLEVIHVADGGISELTMFVSTDWFAAFGLPDRL
jgi:RNA polymerase sigma-70 factor (ECF subfamily)